MTRLTEADVNDLTRGLRAFEDDLRGLTGLDLHALALRTAGLEASAVPLQGARVAAVPVSTGEGFIPGFCRCVTAILRHLGCDAWITEQPDVRGIQAAVSAGAEVVFLADDHRFIALNLSRSRCVDDDPATADGYVTALEVAAGGLRGRDVLLLGLGPVGQAAARCLLRRGAKVAVAEPDDSRVAVALEAGLQLERTELPAGLARCDLVFDATPAADIIDLAAVTPQMIAAVPGLPSAFASAAQEALGARHLHEPLAVGVAVMAVRALA
jgi:pyrrolysine biosynthesis protein PylD